MQQELVSIITPMYNAERFVALTIESVLSQTYPHWEMLIVNDGSTDRSAAIVEQYALKDDRITLITQKNRGSASARNNGIQRASGRYICFLDSDDLWLPEMLEQQTIFISSKQVGLVYASYSKINKDGKNIYRPLIVPTKVGYSDLLKTNSISCLTAMYDTTIIGKPLFDESLKSMRDDLAYWLAILIKEKFAYGNTSILGFYRVYSSSTTGQKRKLIQPTFLFYYRYLKLGFWTSMYYTIMWGVNGLIKYR